MKTREFRYLSDESFHCYGYGVFAYFEMIKCMIVLFIVCTLCTLPALVFFKQQEAILDGSYAEYSLGSVYQSKVECFSTPLAAKNLLLTCEAKDLAITEIFSVGLIPADSSAKDTCFFEADHRCNSFIDKEKLKTAILNSKEKLVQINHPRTYLIKPAVESEDYKECSKPGALLVAQVGCTQTENYIEVKD